MSRLPRATALSRSLAALAVLLFAASPAAAQTTAVVCGTVTDATAGVMPGVSVTLQRDAAPLTLNAVTDKEGDYVFANVSPGTYRITFWQDGFKKAVRNGIILTAGFWPRVDQRMEVASPVTYVDPPDPTVAYDRPMRTGSSFTKDIVTAVPTVRTSQTGRPAPPRPCKIEKY